MGKGHWLHGGGEACVAGSKGAVMVLVACVHVHVRGREGGKLEG